MTFTKQLLNGAPKNSASSALVLSARNKLWAASPWIHIGVKTCDIYDFIGALDDFIFAVITGRDTSHHLEELVLWHGIGAFAVAAKVYTILGNSAPTQLNY